MKPSPTRTADLRLDAENRQTAGRARSHNLYAFGRRLETLYDEVNCGCTRDDNGGFKTDADPDCPMCQGIGSHKEK